MSKWLGVVETAAYIARTWGAAVLRPYKFLGRQEWVTSVIQMFSFS